MILSSAKEIGALIRDRRTQLGLSQQALAQKAGVGRLWIVQLENGKPSAQLGLVLRTLRELGIPMSININSTGDSQKPPAVDLAAVIRNARE